MQNQLMTEYHVWQNYTKYEMHYAHTMSKIEQPVHSLLRNKDTLLILIDKTPEKNSPRLQKKDNILLIPHRYPEKYLNTEEYHPIKRIHCIIAKNTIYLDKSRLRKTFTLNLHRFHGTLSTKNENKYLTIDSHIYYDANTDKIHFILSPNTAT